jgi:hypothetical protein
MPSVTRKHFRYLTHGASGTFGAYGTPRTSGAPGTLKINEPRQSS